MFRKSKNANRKEKGYLRVAFILSNQYHYCTKRMSSKYKNDTRRQPQFYQQ